MKRSHALVWRVVHWLTIVSLVAGLTGAHVAGGNSLPAGSDVVPPPH
jgi:hypothetical protein